MSGRAAVGGTKKLTGGASHAPTSPPFLFFLNVLRSRRQAIFLGPYIPLCVGDSFLGINGRDLVFPSATLVSGKFLGIVGQDSCDSTSHRLHVDIFRCCFHSFKVCFVYRFP
jgi:hypothetical protein